MPAEPLVSVVVPVYNGAEYLDECLTSIRDQTYERWTCVVVDNASTDDTAKIAERHTSADERFVHRRFDEFVSATDNHNRAFAAVDPDSEFCKMVQGDDWLYPECLERMVEAGLAHPTAGIVSAYQLWGDNVHLNGLPYATTFVPGREALRATLRGDYNVTGGPTAHMMRSRWMREREPFWEHGLRHQDTEAALWLLSRHDLAFVHQVLTYARKQAGARSDWSIRMRSDRAEDIVFVLRYGRSVMDDVEYRDRLRWRLRRYVRWHVRQAAHLSWLRDAEFFRFHRLKCRQILEASGGDREVAAAVAVVRLLLLRGGAARVAR